MQLLDLDVQIVTAVRTLLLWFDVTGGRVADKLADGDTDGTGYLLGGVSPSIVLCRRLNFFGLCILCDAGMESLYQ